MTAPAPLAKPTMYCSFCAKSQHQVDQLIAGPRSICICDECVVLCVDVINEKRAERAAAGRGEEAIAPEVPS